MAATAAAPETHVEQERAETLARSGERRRAVSRKPATTSAGGPMRPTALASSSPASTRSLRCRLRSASKRAAPGSPGAIRCTTSSMNRSITVIGLLAVEDRVQGGGELPPLRPEPPRLLLSLVGDPVVLAGHTPLGVLPAGEDETSLLEPVQDRVQRAVPDLRAARRSAPRSRRRSRSRSAPALRGG